MKIDRRDQAHHVNGIVDVIELDMADKSNIQKSIVRPFLGQSQMSVQVAQVNCTGIAGSWILKQSVGDRGDSPIDLVEGALSIVAAATGVGAIVKGTLTMEFLVIQLPATLPATGKVVITITGKAV